MPPVSKANQTTFEKDVDFVAKDDAEQIATGIVMVPYAVDLQHDWERPETIAEFAEQFENFEEVGEASGGVMHAVFPDEWMVLERNEVLEEATEIGGKTAPAGAWVQEWKFEDDELWSLVDDNIFEGYSIGADAVHWEGPMEQEELPDEVSVPGEIEDDALVWELVDGIVREVSAVDIPAVPDAEILETKADAAKRLSDHLGNRDGFIDEAMQRGHSEEAAERMWDVLDRASDVEGAGEPGKASYFRSVGEKVVSALWGSDDDGRPKTAESDVPPAIRDARKDGRTLSAQNRDSLFATIDAAADVLEDAGIDHGITRFTDRDDVEFDLSEHDARLWSGGGDNPDEDDPDGDEDDDQDDKHASGGDTPDESGTEAAAMSDDNGNTDEDIKDLVERNAEQLDEVTSAVSELTEAISGPEPKTATFEIDGETYEVPEDAAKAALGVDGDTDVAEAIERLQQKAGRVEEVEQRLDTISQQSGVSTQLEASRDGDNGEEKNALDALGGALS